MVDVQPASPVERSGGHLGHPVTARLTRVRDPLIAAGVVAAATLALHVRDPHVTHSWGVCPLYALTGVYCPGCGGLRAVNDLGNGDLGAAASSNLLLVVAVPIVLVLFTRWTRASWQGRRVALLPTLPRWGWVAVTVVLAVFTLLRNLPGSWLAP